MSGLYSREKAFQVSVDTLLKYNQTIVRCGATAATLIGPGGPIRVLIAEGRAIRAARTGTRAAEAATTARLTKLSDIIEALESVVTTATEGTSCSAAAGVVAALANVARTVGVFTPKASSFYFSDTSSVRMPLFRENECTVSLRTGRTRTDSRSYGDTYRIFCDDHG